MNIRKTITTLARVLVGALFIFSGFIKANDPYGFGFKLEEYFGVFEAASGIAFTVFNPISVWLSIGICVFEIFLGFTLLLGVFRRFTLWMLMLMIVFFTFLTFYSALFDKVTDCGCFGDALKLTPWESFWKDIVLLVLIAILFINRKYITPFLPKTMSEAIAWGALAFSTLFSLGAWYTEPYIDFRPYRVGNDIQEKMTVPEGAPKDSIVMAFRYKSKVDGSIRTFTMDELGDLDTEQYEFVGRKDKVIRKGYVPPIHDFNIVTIDGQDITDSFLSAKGLRLMIVHYDVNQSNTARQDDVNNLVNAVKGRLPVLGISGSSTGNIMEYTEEHNVPYPTHTMDGTTVKTMMRSNPGLILFRDNVVVAKWPATALPRAERLLKEVE